MSILNGTLYFGALVGIVYLANAAWNSWAQPIIATMLVLFGLWFLGAAIWEMWYGE